MAHFAKLDANNLVTQVIVVADEDTSDNNGNEIESIGIGHCQKITGDTNWKKTSYNAYGDGYRGNYAGVGFTYMENVATLGVGSTDVFIQVQPYASWTLGVNTATWYAPLPPGESPGLTTAQSDAVKFYIWNESNYQSNPATAWVLTDP